MEEASAMPSNGQEFCLRWNNFHSSLISALDGFKNDLDFVDVTLACEGQFLKAHKMLLSACSVFFRDLLKANPCQHPIVILPTEVRFIDLEKMLRFIYQGEVNVQQEHLARFLKTAEMLKIRGLADDNDKRSLRSTSPKPTNGNGGQNSNEGRSVSPKRPRLSIEAQTGSERPQTPNEENSRLSGADSDSEMIPVKQELVELKECDFESADAESFIPEAYLGEGPSANCSNNSQINNQQPSQSHPAAPPPPGPLLPSYVPPPQIKAQDDSSLNSNHEELSQGTHMRLILSQAEASEGRGGGCEGEQDTDEIKFDDIRVHWAPGDTPKSAHNLPRFALPRSTSVKLVSAFKSPPTPSFHTLSAVSPPEDMSVDSPKVCSDSKTLVITPNIPVSQASQSCTSPSVVVVRSPSLTSSSNPTVISTNTGTSLAIWHPPQPKQQSPSDINIGSAANLPGVVFSALPISSSVSGCTITFSVPPPTMSLTCDICSKTFTSRSNLNKHKRVQHSGEEYVCPICQRSFKNRYYIKDHVNLCSSQSHKKPLASIPVSGEFDVDYSFDPSSEDQPTSLVKRTPNT